MPDFIDFSRVQRYLADCGSAPVDTVVTSLRSLGGIGHVQDIAIQARAMDKALPAPSIRRLLQQYSSDAVWSKSVKPGALPDLFYSVEGVQEHSGFWGLRFFDVHDPDSYPIETLSRPYGQLYSRLDTPLGPIPRGIAYRFGRVHAIQVGFALGSPYPDRLLTDGWIEHIGEGRGPVQTPVGGNAGMLEAERNGYDIPVYQAIGSKGNKKYALLGAYKVMRHSMREIYLPDSPFATRAYVFSLKPSRTV